MTRGVCRPQPSRSCVVPRCRCQCCPISLRPRGLTRRSAGPYCERLRSVARLRRAAAASAPPVSSRAGGFPPLGCTRPQPATVRPALFALFLFPGEPASRSSQPSPLLSIVHFGSRFRPRPALFLFPDESAIGSYAARYAALAALPLALFSLFVDPATRPLPFPRRGPRMPFWPLYLFFASPAGLPFRGRACWLPPPFSVEQLLGSAGRYDAPSPPRLWSCSIHGS